MKKKVFALLLAAVMLLSLAACGGGSGSGSGSGSGDDGSGGSSDSGKTVLNLWAFTDEVPKMVDKFLANNPDFAEKYEVKTTIIWSTTAIIWMKTAARRWMPMQNNTGCTIRKGLGLSCPHPRTGTTGHTWNSACR